jgi:Cse1
MGCEAIHGSIILSLLQLLFSKTGNVADIINEGTLEIAKLEYPGRWSSLPGDAVAFLGENHNINLRVFELIQGVTEKYTECSRSDNLFREILDVIEKVHDKLLQYAEGYLNGIQSATTPSELEMYMSILASILKIFYNINWQDLSEAVEDNLQSWMKIIQGVMNEDIKSKFEGSNLGDLEDVYLKCKGEAINCSLLYAKKYREEFMPLIDSFAQSIWQICTETNKDSLASDNVTILALHYFKTFVENPNFIQFFAERLEEMFKNLIIKNITPGNMILELFEDEPESFTESLIENRELDERSKNCLQFVKSLSRF